MNINWFPGHMAKTRRQIEEDLKIIDVVIELLEARIPLASRNPEIQRLTKNKKRIILLNKCDLANETANNKWVSYLSKEAPTILTDSNSGKGIRKKVEEVNEEKEKEFNEKVDARAREIVTPMLEAKEKELKASFSKLLDKYLPDRLTEHD